MNIVVAFDEAFARHASAMLASCMDHGEIKNVFAIVADLSSESARQFTSSLKKRGINCQILDVSSAGLEGFPVIGHMTKMTYARLLATDLLPREIERVLYLDCDLVVMSRLDELWNHPLGGCPVACVHDAGGGHAQSLGMASDAHYFNAGVMLWDVAELRRRDVMSQAREYLRKYPERIVYCDQDALNVVLEGSWMEMPARWNARFRPDAEGRWRSNLAPGERPAIVHFDGAGLKPWQVGQPGHPYRYAYTRARWRSGWPLYADPAWFQRPRNYATRLLRGSIRRARSAIGR